MIRPIKFIMIKSMDKTKLKLIFFIKNVNEVQKLFVLVYIRNEGWHGYEKRPGRV